MQIKKGLVDILILNILSKNDNYGYEIRECIEKVFSINESSIYLALTKLESNNLITSYLRTSDYGPVRKYFKINNNGIEYLRESIYDWIEISTHVNNELGIK